MKIPCSQTEQIAQFYMNYALDKNDLQIQQRTEKKSFFGSFKKTSKPRKNIKMEGKTKKEDAKAAGSFSFSFYDF